MALFPRIVQPCPYLDRFDTILEGDGCRVCKRKVHDLSAMEDAARAEFLASCQGRTCVSYRVPAMAASALAASAALMAPILTLGEARSTAEPETTMRTYPITEHEHVLAGLVLPLSEFRGVPEPALDDPTEDVGNVIDNQSDPELDRTAVPEVSS